MHTYYLIGTKKSTDEYIKTLYKEKRTLIERKEMFKDCKYLKEELAKLDIEIKETESRINEKITENRLIKRVLFMEIGSWYKYYKKGRW